MGQHRIPDFHLRNFGDQLYIYDRSFSTWKSDRVGPRRISNIKNRWPQEIEDFFKEIDTRSCLAMRKLIGGESITHIERGYLAEYVALMACSRGAHPHKQLMEMMRDYFFSVEHEGDDSLSESQLAVVDGWKRGRLEELAKSPDRARMEKSPELLALFMAPPIGVTQRLAAMRWRVYHGGPFVCCDSPAWISSGLKYSTCRVGMALSDMAYLVLDWEREGPRLLHVKGKRRAPKWLNHMTIIHTYKEIYCSSRLAWLPGLEQKLQEPRRANQIVEEVSPQTIEMESCPACGKILDVCRCWPDGGRMRFSEGVVEFRVPMIGENRAQRKGE